MRSMRPCAPRPQPSGSTRRSRMARPGATIPPWWTTRARGLTLRVHRLGLRRSDRRHRRADRELARRGRCRRGQLERDRRGAGAGADRRGAQADRLQHQIAVETRTDLECVRHLSVHRDQCDAVGAGGMFRGDDAEQLEARTRLRRDRDAGGGRRRGTQQSAQAAAPRGRVADRHRVGRRGRCAHQQPQAPEHHAGGHHGPDNER